MCDEKVREMVTYLLQNSPPPPTIVISQVKYHTSGRCVFIGYLINAMKKELLEMQ
jgi:hypothetical protein